MQTRRLGRTDLSIAPLVLGGNVFGWTADKKTSFAVLDRFADGRPQRHRHRRRLFALGARQSGRRIGDDHRRVDEGAGQPRPDHRHHQGRLAHGQGQGRTSARYIEEAVEASLKRLQTDVIDLYLSHWPDMATPIEETLGAYQRLIEKGKIRWCGASNLNVALLEAALAAAKASGLPRYEVLQPEYNLADRARIRRTASPTSASARSSASSPISAWRRASCRASTAPRPTSRRARAASA